MKLEFLDRFSKITQISNFMKTVEWEPSGSIRTDGQIDMTKLIVAFQNFENAPKNEFPTYIIAWKFCDCSLERSGTKGDT